MSSFFASQLYSPSLELILLVAAAIANGLLAYAVYTSNRLSATNRIFALLSVATIGWLVANYITNHLPADGSYSDLILLVHRSGIFFAAPMSSLFFLLAHTIPFERVQMKIWMLYSVIGATVLMMIVNISPLAFTGVEISASGSSPIPGPGLIPFSALSTIFSILAIFYLVRKYIRLQTIEKYQVKLVLIGMFTMLGLIIATVLIPILVFNSVQFLVLTPIYTLIFLGMTAYAITKYQLFDIKVLVTQALTIVMVLVIFAKLFGEESLNAQIIDALLLAFMIVFGFFLVRSVKREVAQRHIIEQQAHELEEANRKQVSLIHFISHEVKGYLTKSEAGFASILEGDMGAVSETLKSMATAALADVRKGVATVMDILEASNLQKGTVAYKQERFDFAAAVGEVVGSLRSAAEARGLQLIYTKDITGPCIIEGDGEKLGHHVIRNLVDNAVKYTLKGAVTVALSRPDHTLRFSVKDTGVGITPDDMKNLFKEGGKGKDSTKVNVDSTGYGLYIAKQVVEAHGGKLRAESEGKDKGSTFIVELPISKEA